MPPVPALTIRRWLRSGLFGSYLRNFFLLWLTAKLANAFIAAHLGLPPLAFRPGPEMGACAIELLALAAYIRRGNEDILLGNLGWSLPAALAPLVPVHVGLSLVLSLLP